MIREQKKVKKNKKLGNSLLLSLSKYYITFVFSLLIIFLVSYIILGYTLSNNINNKRIPLYNIINDSGEDIEKINYKDINKIGGYVEILNNDREVIKRIGDSGTYRTSYTEEELLESISSNNEDYSVLVNIGEKDGEKVTILIWLPKNKLSYEFNLLKVPYSVGKYIYNLYLKVIGVAVLIGIINIIIYSVWTTKKINNPLKKIDEALVKIIDGDYDEKLDLNYAVEFEVIGDTINFLTEKLKLSEEENKRLTESKNRMLMDLSHDIKTPITTIRGFSAALNSGLVKDEEQRERYYKTIYNKSERVGELVDDLFEIVRLENDGYILNLQTTDICELIREIVLEFIDELEEKEFELDINIPDKPINLAVDVKMFKRVIVNLIENAIKYNENNTKLRVEVEELEDSIVIEIADNGVGIRENVRNNIFDEFVRGDESRGSDGGSGLGLAIAQKIIHLHHGEINLLDPTSEEKTIFHIKVIREKLSN